MDHDVFISYSSKNTPIAELVLDELQKASIKCWMAPKSLNGGDEYEEIIDQAIKNCKVFVLVFSENAVSSRWVNSELTIAFNEYKHIIPFKIDQTILEGKMKVKLIQSHVINAYPEVSAKINELVRSVQATLAAIENQAEDVERDESAKELNFFQRFEYEDAVAIYHEKKYAEAIDLLLPLALKSNRKSQEALCDIYYDLSVSSYDGDVLRSISPKVKDIVEVVAGTGADWANFIMHCYASTQNDNDASLNYLKQATVGDSIGLAFLRLGIAYGWGLGVEVSFPHAIECYKRAESLGCSKAYSYLGQLYRWGYDDCLPDAEKATEYFRKGIDAGDWRAIKRMLQFYTKDSEGLAAAAAFLEELSERDIDGLELLYGDYYWSKYYLQGNEDEDFSQAVEFLEIALNNGYYEACGYLSSLYYNIDDVKSKDYAEIGFQHGDGYSYWLLANSEKSNGNFSRAWEILEERVSRFGFSAGDLGQLYIVEGYLPSEGYLPTLVKSLQTSAALGHLDSCQCLVTLYSDEKYGMKDPSMEEKYRLRAAMAGLALDEESGVKPVLEYAQYLSVKDTPHYNPRTAIKYLKKAIDRKSTDAAVMFLKQFSRKESVYYRKQYEKACNYVLKSGVYDIETMFFDLYATPITEANAVVAKDFFMKSVQYSKEARGWKKEHRMAESCMALIRGHCEGRWTLSEKELGPLKAYLVENIKTIPGAFHSLKDCGSVLFPEYDEVRGKDDFMAGRDSLHAELFYALNFASDYELFVDEQEELFRNLLGCVKGDMCYDEIVRREDVGLVVEEEIWSDALSQLDYLYGAVADKCGFQKHADLSRCDFEDIVPFFPQTKAIDYHKRAARALIDFAEHFGYSELLAVLHDESATLDFCESIADQDVQLYIIQSVLLRVDVENLIVEGQRLLKAVLTGEYESLSSFVGEYIKKLDDAGVKHSLSIPNEAELKKLIVVKKDSNDNFDSLLSSFMR